LGDEYFRFEEASRAMVGTRTKETFRLGDAVQVRLVEAVPFAGALRFEIVRPGSDSRNVRKAGASALRRPTYKGKRR
jgi:ribonuclease R